MERIVYYGEYITSGEPQNTLKSQMAKSKARSIFLEPMSDDVINWPVTGAAR